ncbi:MAG: ribosome small subunit-dependent GTPase A [Fidelibacterota bacterium]|nr:MAG: ribosome small subunit-dependent GTPase A [Candidatus Neomarinimicrobiota bacterium]
MLEAYGLTDAVLAALAELGGDDSQPARIITGVRQNYRVITAGGELPATATGRLQFDTDESADLPVAGDWVAARIFDDQAVIHQVLPRRTSLMRKSSGRGSAQQVLAANVDTLFIVQSLDRDFNLRRLERYLVMAREGGVEPVILLSKRDLHPEEDIPSFVAQAQAVSPDTPVLVYSAQDSSGVDAIRARLRPGQTFCLAGSSGVGKSTLINQLLGESRLATRPVREKDARGRHATTRRELILLPEGGVLIDTPGMRELGVLAEQSSLESTFPEIEALAPGCRYGDCRHQQEPGCAVRQAVESGDLPRSRYDSYLKLARELAYNATQADQLSRLKYRRAQKRLFKSYKVILQRKPRF